MTMQSRQSHAMELTLFLWHLPDDTTESITEHSSRLQPSINCKPNTILIVILILSLSYFISIDFGLNMRNSNIKISLF